MATLLEAHSAVPDPHGDRAYADARFIPIDGDVVNKSRTVDKSEDLSRQTTSLSDDPDLSQSIEANARYAFTTFLSVDGDTTAGITFGFSAPQGVTGFWGQGTRGNRLAFSQTSTATISASGLTLTLSGSILVGSNSGSFSLRWAQTQTGSTSLFVRAGSWLRLMRTA